MNRREKILELYYENEIKAIDVANKCQVSKQYVSKIIKEDERYETEKAKRKEQTQLRKKIYTDKKMKEIRKQRREINEFLKKQHFQDVMELSAGKMIISNRAFRKWNSSVYQYNRKKKCYEYDKKLIRTYATPRYVK